MPQLSDDRYRETASAVFNGALLADTEPLIPCNPIDAYNFERLGNNLYCLTLAVPGFAEDEIDISADGGYLRIRGSSHLMESAGDVLHRGLEAKLDITFLMTRPLELDAAEVRCGLLRITLRDQPGTGVEAAFPPRLQGIEALALAA